MNKEEILAKSREENKNRDIYGQEVSKLANSVAVVVMLVLAAVFFIVQIAVGGGKNYGLWALVFGADMANHWVRYIKLRLGGELLAALIYTAIVVLLSVCHIYSLTASI